uniref:Uncharacterized protein n=1 Tax=Lepeophtheirus salmonis TaxID=72036 RepID=A0A0K2SWX2_LEPSM
MNVVLNHVLLCYV